MAATQATDATENRNELWILFDWPVGDLQSMTPGRIVQPKSVMILVTVTRLADADESSLGTALRPCPSPPVTCPSWSGRVGKEPGLQ